MLAKSPVACTIKPVSASRSSLLKPFRQHVTRCQAAAVDVSSHPSLPVMRQAARSRDVPAEQLEQSLVQLENALKGTPSQGASQVPGTWHLFFSTASKIRAFQYIPVKEDCVIDVTNNKIALESVVGPFQFHIKGTIYEWTESTGVLDFAFDKGVDILLLGNKIYEVQTGSKVKRKTYTFYYVDDKIAAARSSAGGVSLLRRE